MTFMLCTIMLMFAGLRINIPILRPFYLPLEAGEQDVLVEPDGGHPRRERFEYGLLGRCEGKGPE